jgi:hypothetical protein
VGPVFDFRHPISDLQLRRSLRYIQTKRSEVKFDMPCACPALILQACEQWFWALDSIHEQRIIY